MTKSEIFVKLSDGQLPEDLLPAAENIYKAEVDGMDIPDKDSLMKSMASAFKFPAYFGENWDALADCLRSLPEDELEGYGAYILCVKNYQSMLASLPEEKKNFEDIFMAASLFLSEAYRRKLILVYYGN